MIGLTRLRRLLLIILCSIPSAAGMAVLVQSTFAPERGYGDILLVAAIGLVLLGSLLITDMLFEIKRLRRELWRHSSRPRKDFASDAKSRLLTMMNHELRTPMNGVLGLLALARRSGLTQQQDRLLGQAERAGRHMSALLGDILDYSELQTETMRLIKAPVAASDLKETLDVLLEDIAADRPVEWSVAVDAGSLPAALADAERIRQTLRHVLRFLIETVGTTSVSIHIAMGNGMIELRTEMVTPAADGPGWQPETVFQTDMQRSDQFASDAIGPAIARGLVARMNGTLKIRRRSPTTARLTISIPADAAMQTEPVARIETVSTTSAALMRAMLNQAGWQVWTPGDPDGVVNLVAAELPNRDEAALVARLRVQHPFAWIVGIGRPKNPDLFDAHCETLALNGALKRAIDEIRGLYKEAS